MVISISISAIESKSEGGGEMRYKAYATGIIALFARKAGVKITSLSGGMMRIRRKINHISEISRNNDFEILP